MDSNAINLEYLQSRITELEKGSTRLNLSEVFGDRRGSYVNEFLLFIAHFNSIPNLIQEIKIDCKKASTWFQEIYKEDIKNQYYSKRYFNRSKTAAYDDIIYILYEDLIVDFDTSQSVVRFLFRKTDVFKVDFIIAGIKKFKEKKAKRTPEISFLVIFLDGVRTRSFKISKPVLNIAVSYDDNTTPRFEGVK